MCVNLVDGRQRVATSEISKHAGTPCLDSVNGRQLNVVRQIHSRELGKSFRCCHWRSPFVLQSKTVRQLHREEATPYGGGNARAPMFVVHAACLDAGRDGSAQMQDFCVCIPGYPARLAIVASQGLQACCALHIFPNED